MNAIVNWRRMLRNWSIALLVMIGIGAILNGLPQGEQDGAIAGLMLAFVYFLPAIVASARHHHNATAIGVLNLLLGWTVLGWIGAFVWAFTKPSQREQLA